MEYKLIKEIIELSQSKIWDIAKSEWSLDHIYESEEPISCLCGHFPIIEVCVLHNYLNNKFVTIGNCCVKKFIGLPSDSIFKAFKRIRKDIEKSLNIEAIQYVKDKNWINDWEYNFLIDTIHKKIFSYKQIKMRIRINKKILNVN